MAQLISFKTSLFDPGQERPNPINPIAGESVLHWIRERVLKGKYASSEPDAEDWGWYIEVDAGESGYLIGAGGEFEESDRKSGADLEWLIQIHKQRSIKEKLLGRNKLQDDDPFVAELVDALKGDPSFSDVQVEVDA